MLEKQPTLLDVISLKQKLLTLPEYLRSPPYVSGVRVSHSLVSV